MNLPIIRYLMNLWRNNKLKEFENFMHGDNMDEYSLDKAEKIIKYYESLHKLRDDGMVESYWDSMGEKWSLGYGNTFYEDGSPVKKGDTVTQERAEELFDIIVEDFREKVLASLKTRIDVNQLNALVSFTWNVGIGALRRSTLLRKLNAGAKKEVIGAEFPKWNKSGGVVRRGLVKRRETEKILFLTGEVVLNPQI